MAPAAGFVFAAPGLALGKPVLAQAPFPNRAIGLIMPHTAGRLDVYARLIAPRLQQTLGQPFVVDYKPGANGNIASVRDRARFPGRAHPHLGEPAR